MTDINDNAPQFSKTVYNVAVTEGADVGTNVITVVSTDKDIGMNSRISYKIVSGNIDSKFIITSISIIILNISAVIRL